MNEKNLRESIKKATESQNKKSEIDDQVKKAKEEIQSSSKTNS